MSREEDSRGSVILDRYEVLEALVDDAVERKLRAWDRSLEREVVLKFPGRELIAALSGLATKKVIRESKMIAAVRHPGVATILDAVQTADGPMLVLEPTHGEPLAGRLGQGPLDVATVRRLGIAISRALAAVHAAGVVHRGVNAEAVLLPPDDGDPILSGFSFAKDAQGRPGLTSIDYRGSQDRKRVEIVPTYPAPEQIAGQRADARSDVYSLGCLLYRCLTGQEAFPDEGSHGPSPDPRKVDSRVPRAMSEIVRKCLSASPMSRYQTAGAVADALEAVGAGTGGGGRKRAPWIAAAVVLIAGLAVTIGTWGGGGGGGGDGGGDDRGRNPDTDPGSRGESTVAESGYAPRYEKSHALLIGIGAGYAGTGRSPLVNPVNDVRALKTRLESMPWEKWDVSVLPEKEATREAIIGELLTLARRAGKDDRIFVYFAGHGEIRTGNQASSWIVPVDAKPRSEDPGMSRCVSHDRVLALFHDTPAKHVLIALDSCYSGRSALRSGGPEKVGVDWSAEMVRTVRNEYLSKRAYHILAAAGPHEPARDGSKNSPFCLAFLDALDNAAQKGRAPFLTVNGLFEHIRNYMIGTGLSKDAVDQLPVHRHHEKSQHGEMLFFVRDPSKPESWEK